MMWRPSGLQPWLLLGSMSSVRMGKAFYQWLLSWFNPKPAFADRKPGIPARWHPIRVTTIYHLVTTLRNS